MIRTSETERAQAFRWWMRTGRLPTARGPDGLEVKFNPWHDLEDGRFTFTGSGRYFGASGRAGGGASDGGGTRAGQRDAVAAARGEVGGARREGPSTGRAGTASAVARHYRAGSAVRRRRPDPLRDFVGGIGEGAHDAGRDAVQAVRALVTTHPMTTARNARRDVARAIDTAIAAEAVPARLQVARAATAVAQASSRDVGRAIGAVAASGAMAAVPGGALARMSQVRRLRAAAARPRFDPPNIGWARETLTSQEPWRYYNDGAPGARPGRAPTLMRTMPDGSKRPVKFDGVRADYMIDRKWSVHDRSRSRAQVLRQSQVLAEHRAIGVWEVPIPKMRASALKLLKKLNVTNIKVTVVKP